MWWAKLDNNDGSIGKKSETTSSKWEFYGSYEEMKTWLPEVNTPADWTYLDSRKTSLGRIWAGEGFLVDNIRYTALNRFQYTINITARLDKNNSDFNYKDPGKEEEVPLGSRVDIDIANGSFTLTPEMTGYDWTDASGWTDKTDISADQWVLADDCPFTVRPKKTETNKTFSTTIIILTKYFRGTPLTNGTANANYSGVGTIRTGKTTKKGLVVGQETGKVYDNEGNIFTSLSVSIMLPPAGKEWNINWQ